MSRPLPSLPFAWTFSSGRIRYFHFSVLPFGLSSAPYLFTKLLKSLVKKWRTEGKPIVVFLDDGLGAAPNHNIKAKIDSLAVHSDPLKSGFLQAKEENAVWDPHSVYHKLSSFGFWVPSAPCIRFAKLQAYAEKLSRLGTLGNCVRNVTKLMTKNTYAELLTLPPVGIHLFL